MSIPIDQIDFSKLSLDERTLLAHKLWDSVHQEVESMQLSEAVKVELDRRLAAEESGEMEFSSWEELSERLFSKHRT